MNGNYDIHGGISGEELDRLLDSDAQQAMRAIVKKLDDETPSLAWRSELNVRVRRIAGAESRKRIRWLILRPALGLAAAGALAFAFVLRMPESRVPADTPALEASLIEAHREVSTSIEVAGAGLTAYDMARQQAQAPSDRDLWNEVDLQGL